MHARPAVIGLLLVFSVSAAAGPTMPPVQAVREFEPPSSLRVIVEFRDVHGVRRAAADVDSLFARFRADLSKSAGKVSGSAPEIRHEYRIAILGASVDLHPSQVERIRRLPYVSDVHPDIEVHALTWGASSAKDTIVDARNRVNAASLGTGGAGIVIAVIDTGVDYTHPALGAGFGPGHKVAGGYDFVNRDDDPMDDNGHGTHVAGTIAASSLDIIGVAPDATLFAYKVLGPNGNGLTSDIIAAIERGLDPNGDGDLSDKVDVMNLSLGGAGDAEDPGSRAVDNAVAAGVVMVVAAGNDGRTATIGSPGTAVRAITIAASDDEGAITSFSSRGPSPRLLGFKPDVAAPGDQISSTAMGGGTVALSGTSMATPHVAGVAALLRQLHPDWDPGRVKAAITGGAIRTPDSPFARGTGRVDAMASNAVTLLTDATGISFGIHASRTGTSSTSRTVRLTNVALSTQTLTLAADTVSTAATVIVTPSSLTMTPGESREVTVELRTTNSLLEFPDDALIGGDILVSGTSSRVIPWGILRTARATVTYDGFATSIVAVDAEGARGESLRSPSGTEIFLPPGRTWDFIVVGYDYPSDPSDPFDVRRMVVRQGVKVDGDEAVHVRMSDAPHEITFDARDQRGTTLLSRSPRSMVHTLGIRLYREDGGRTFALSLIGKRTDVRRFFVSSLAQNYSLYAFEQLVDELTYEGYSVEYDVLRGVSESRTLSPGGALLRRLTVAWEGDLATRDTLDVCSLDATKAGGFISAFTTCTPTSTDGRNAFALYINDERSALAHAGMSFRIGNISTQALRGVSGELVASSAIVPSPMAARFPSGGTYTIAEGATFPFAFEGTRTAPWFLSPVAGFVGSAGEQIDEVNGTEWFAFDSSGNEIGRGVWRGPLEASTIPSPRVGARFVAARNDLGTSGGGRGRLEVECGTNGFDLTAPTLTSLRVIDGTDRIASRLMQGRSARLDFSIADLDYARSASTNPSSPEKTHVWYRTSGSTDWIPLPVVITGLETGSLTSLRHVPAGDIYRADLSSTTLLGDEWIDLLIEFEDLSGNRTRWTHERAYFVAAPKTEPRMRPVRR